MTPDMEKVQVELDALNTLADEYRRCYEDPAGYCWNEFGVGTPGPQTWTAWSETQREIIAADLCERGGRLAVLLGVQPGDVA